MTPTISPVDVIDLGRRYSVDQAEWCRASAYYDLCLRSDTLTLEEGNLLGMEDVIKIVNARQERIHTPALRTLEGIRKYFNLPDKVKPSNQIALSINPVNPTQGSESFDVGGGSNLGPADAHPVIDVFGTTLSGDELIQHDTENLLEALKGNSQYSHPVLEEMISWIDKPENGRGDRTLVLVIRAILAKVVIEGYHAAFVWIIHTLMTKINPKLKGDGITDFIGNSIAGSELFRYCFLKEFERNSSAESQTEKQRFALISFIDDLHRAHADTASIVIECVKSLLVSASTENSDRAVRSLCQLLVYVGARLDQAGYRAQLDLYLVQLRELSSSEKIGALMRVTAKVRFSKSI